MSYPIPPTPAGVDDSAWARAVGEIREYCEWHVAPEVTETVTLDGPGGRLLLLPTQRVSDVIEVVNNGKTVTDPEWSASGMVRGSCWSSKFRGVSVTLTHGYEMWPDDLTKVALEVISSASYAGVTQVTSGSHQVSFEASLTSSQRATLNRYRLVEAP